MGRNNSRSLARIYIGAFAFQFINGIFYFKYKSYLSNYADDNVLYTFASNMTEVKDKLSQDLPKLSEWYRKLYDTKP